MRGRAEGREKKGNIKGKARNNKGKGGYGEWGRANAAGLRSRRKGWEGSREWEWE